MSAVDQAAPERIWANGLGGYGELAGFGGVEYVRADLATPSSPAEVEGLTDTQKIERMADLNWKPASQYWKEQHDAKATALTEMQAENERMRAELENERQHHVNTESLWNVDRGLIEELRRELAEARASAAAAYERAAKLCDDTAQESLDESGTCSRILWTWFRGQSSAIRSLATEAENDALAEHDKRVREDFANELRRLAKDKGVVSDILARLDQRKEAGV